MLYDNTYVTVDLDAVSANIAAVRRKAGVPVMAVLKADAYGHGAVALARELAGQCEFFGMSCISEAVELRRAGIQQKLLILGHTPDEAFDLAVEQDIRTTVYTEEMARALSAAALRQGRTAAFHFAVDTGMSRIGFPCTPEGAEACARVARLPGLFAEGLFSHYATADCAELTRARAQAERFDRFVALLEQQGLRIPLCHMDNSAGVMNFSRHYGMVRAGIVTYGLYPSDRVDPQALPLRPALSWYSRVTHVKLLPAGREISYGGTYVTEAPTLVATVPVGYGDGYRRSLSGRFYVLIGGKRAPILGRVCMDQMMVDVTHIPGVAVGSHVVLLGSDGDETVTVEQMAEAAGSFNYETVCGISRRVPRYYLKGGQLCHTVHYLLD